jgi:excisionase family DNA binding protein
MEEEELLTVKEAALRLKVTEKTIKAWLNKGQLKGYKAGRQWRITPGAIQEFLQANRPGTQERRGL